MEDNLGFSDSNSNLNGTYTIASDPGLPPLNVRTVDERRTSQNQNVDYVLNMPVTPREVDPTSDSVDGERRRSRSSSRHKSDRHHKKKKKRAKERLSVVEIDQAPIVSHESDASTGTYTMPSTSTQGALSYLSLPQGSPVHSSAAVSPSRQPVVEDPIENRSSSLRRRNRKGSVKPADEPGDESKAKTFRKRRNHRKRKDSEGRELGVSLAVEKVRDFVQSKFHKREPLDVTDFRSGKPLHIPLVSQSRSAYHDLQTDAYGKINFSKDQKSSYEPPYIRLSSNDDMDDLLQLMSEHWQLPDPKLIVSIVGGAKRFQFAKNRISTLFKNGLLDIATTTGAWVLTPGTNTGVYKMVGSAVKDHIDSTGSAAMNNIVLLGIASWGSVAGRERLEEPEGNGKFPAIYPLSDISGQDGTQPLEPNHSHFILVDDGSRDKFGGEIQWRAKFEKFLMDHVITGTNSKEGETDEVYIPLVTLLVNGGVGSIKACSESLQAGIPLVAIAGSGRAAQVVVLLHRLIQRKAKDTRPTDDELVEEYRKAMGSEPKSDMISCLQTIAHHNNNISVFDFTHSDIGSDEGGLDRAILSALYRKDNMDISKRKAQMRLALSWNRVDYARDEILDINNPDYKDFMKEESFLHEVAFEALVEDMQEFVALFVDHGLNLREFVTEKLLEKLYTQSMLRDEAYSRFVRTLFDSSEVQKERNCASCTASVLPEDSPGYMHKIGRLLKVLLGYTYPNIYKKSQEGNAFSCMKGTHYFRDPAQHLFIWATLFNRMDIARMFWKYSKDHIAGAIVAAAVLRGLAKKSNHQEGIDITASYLDNSLRFEMLANGILDCCWTRDRQYTSDMLVREAPNWGNATVLSMAYNAEMEEFLAQPACYTKLNKIWRGDISLRTSIYWILLYAVMPLSAFMLKFVRKKDCDPRIDERQNDPVFIEDLTTGDDMDTSPAIYKPMIDVTLLGRSKLEISYPVAIYRAWRSPIVKCVHYSLFFTSFLAVYSLFLLTELKPFTGSSSNYTALLDECSTCCLGTLSSIGCLEIVTYCCALGNILEELRQVLLRDTRPMKYIKQKFVHWWADFWNRVDVFSHLSFIVAICVRFTVSSADFEVARWLYSFSLMVYFVRFSQIFFVVEQLGPKIIMIRKMMVDLLFFIVILSMTILAFGVISHSIIHPGASLNWQLLSDVIYRPYFQMYGELFLEEFGEGYRWILLAFYMIITNILLLNLLIAMFSYTFEQVQEKSAILWKYNYYAVVYEYFDRPYVPLFGSFYQLFKHLRWCKQNSRCCGGRNTNQNTDFRMKLAEDVNLKITKFVKVCMEKFLSQESKLKNEDMSNKVTNTARRLELVIGQLDDLRDDVVSQQTEKKPLKVSAPTPSLAISSSRPPADGNWEKKFHQLESTIESKLNRINVVESKIDRMMEMLAQSDN